MKYRSPNPYGPTQRGLRDARVIDYLNAARVEILDASRELLDVNADGKTKRHARQLVRTARLRLSYALKLL